MSHQPELLCSHSLSYLLGQLAEQERGLFEEHLASCENCRQEIAELHPVLQIFPYSSDEMPVAEDLKQRTLQTAFHARVPMAETEQGVVNSFGRSAWQLFITNRYGKLAVGLVAALTIALGVTSWQFARYKEQQSGAKIIPAATTQVDRSFPLYTAGDTSKIAGIAYVTQTPSGVQLVVQVQNAPPLSGEQTYQVWLLKNGQRQNAGTFRVNDRGEGILVYSEGSTVPDFDNIGITKEPDPNGTSPRGQKVFGTKL